MGNEVNGFLAFYFLIWYDLTLPLDAWLNLPITPNMNRSQGLRQGFKGLFPRITFLNEVLIRINFFTHFLYFLYFLYFFPFQITPPASDLSRPTVVHEIGTSTDLVANKVSGMGHLLCVIPFRSSAELLSLANNHGAMVQTMIYASDVAVVKKLLGSLKVCFKCFF